MADDDPSVRNLVVLALELEGFTVLAAADGREALEMACLHHPAAVILDAVMPHLNGMEVSRRLRLELGRGPAVVMLTGRTDVADRVAAFAAGADDYVVKPVRVTELVDRVKRHLHWPSPRGTGRLLGSPDLYEDLRRRLDAGEATAAVCVEVGGLPPFSRHYSFARSERVLRWLADVLLRLAAERPGTTVGRLGAEDFLVVTSPDATAGLTEALLDAFAARVCGFYDPADAVRGWIEVVDRSGQTRRHRPLALSVGVASSASGASGHHLDLVERAAEMARYARTPEGSRVAVDRRRVMEKVEERASTRSHSR
ncbi:MAG TPA: response regulator [Acidimicrobiia bacterium]